MIRRPPTSPLFPYPTLSRSSPQKKPQAEAPVPPSAPPPAPPPAVAFTAPPSPSPEQLAAQQARQWLGQYRFFGYLGPGGGQRAVLSKGEGIFIVPGGDFLGGRST